MIHLNMRHKALWIVFAALFTVVLALSSVQAQIVDITEVEVNGVVANPGTPTVAGIVSETVPVEVEFRALANVTDVKVRVFIEGLRDDVSVTTDRFHIVDDSVYAKRFSVTLPSTDDMDDPIEDVFLVVRISAKGETAVEEEYLIRLQRELYSLNVLSVEAPNRVIAGDTLDLDVVLENNGHERLDNTYVRASIPELGISRRIYFGDLSPNEEGTLEDIRDAVNRKVYLSIPRNTAPGTYAVEVEAYNFDTVVRATKHVNIVSPEAGIVPSVTSRAISTGEEAVFNFVLVNPHDRMVVYTITPQEAPGLLIGIPEPVVTVPADSSRTVQVTARATESAQEGTHLVTVNANTQDGLSRQVTFTLQVEKDGTGLGVSGNRNNVVLTLTVILVIIFVVLLIVLIVLLTRAPEQETEEFGETSYY